MWEDKKENVRRHISDTITHKYFFIRSCLKMLNYLYECDRYEDALELARRCSLHDHSKLENDEVEQFIKLPLEEPDRKGPKPPLTDEQKRLIELHWSRNRHHPEYFKDCNEMSEVDILEMVCDWHARSKQFKTESLMQFANDVQRKRFEFNEETFEKILSYCAIMEKQ